MIHQEPEAFRYLKNNLTESSKPFTSNAKSIKLRAGTYSDQVEYKLHLTSRDSCYSVVPDKAGHALSK